MAAHLPSQTELLANFARINEQIAEAAQLAGRQAEEVKLVAVSKTKPVELIQQAYAAGHQVFGENKVQEMQAKHEAFPEAQYHLVGHLQRNKVKFIVPFVALIHSLDSVRLLQEIEKRAAALPRTVHCLVQVNVSEEAQKDGASEQEAEAILQAATHCAHVQLDGLMAIAELTDDTEKLRRQFRHLRQLRDKWATTYNGPTIALKELSMGMSNDFPVAIEEGATYVRVGSSLFGNRA